jgi:hypothetical protein
LVLQRARTMHKYANQKNYAFTSPSLNFKRYEPPVEVPQQQTQAPQAQTQAQRVKFYLPGERLLKKLNKAEEKKKPLNMRIIEQSISDILDTL